MTEVRPLYVHGQPTPEQVQLIRLAKEELGVEFFVRVERPEVGVHGNILAFEPVPFVINGGIANLTPPFNLARMTKALAEVLEVEEPVHLMTTAQQLSEWFGSEVKYLYDEEIKDEH